MLSYYCYSFFVSFLKVLLKKIVFDLLSFVLITRYVIQFIVIKIFILQINKIARWLYYYLGVFMALLEST